MRNVKPNQGNEGNRKAGPAAGPVNERSCCDNMAAKRLHRVHAFPRRQARCHNVLNEKAPLTSFNPEAAPQLEGAVDTLEKDRWKPKLAAYLIANDNAAHGRRNNKVGGDVCGPDFLRKRRTQLLRALRFHQDPRALKVSDRMEARGKYEMAFEESPGFAEFFKDGVVRQHRLL